jgi:hypothetical protein
MLKKLLLIQFAFIFLLNCSDQSNVDPTPPDQVRMVEKQDNSDLLDNEPGIDAEYDPISETNDIKLMWYRHPQESKLAYFKIYRTDDPDGLINYKLIGTTENQVNEVDTTYKDTQDLVLDTRYYYYVTALSDQDAESAPSDTVFYTLIPKAENLTLNNNASVISKTEMNFSWSREISAREFILRVEWVISATFTPLVYINVIDSYDNPVIYSLAGDSLKSIFPNGNYRWRVDCVGADLFTGSEAEGADFTVNWSN